MITTNMITIIGLICMSLTALIGYFWGWHTGYWRGREDKRREMEDFQDEP